MPSPPFLPRSFLSSVQASSYLELASWQLRSLDSSSKLSPQNSGRFPSRKVSHRLIRVLPVANVVAFSSSWACMPQEGTRIRKPGRKARGVVVFSKTGEHRHDYTPTEDREKKRKVPHGRCWCRCAQPLRLGCRSLAGISGICIQMGRKTKPEEPAASPGSLSAASWK